jgi:hypothetical protein
VGKKFGSSVANPSQLLRLVALESMRNAMKNQMSSLLFTSWLGLMLLGNLITSEPREYHRIAIDE